MSSATFQTYQNGSHFMEFLLSRNQNQILTQHICKQNQNEKRKMQHGKCEWHKGITIHKLFANVKNDLFGCVLMWRLCELRSIPFAKNKHTWSIQIECMNLLNAIKPHKLYSPAWKLIFQRCFFSFYFLVTPSIFE